MTSAQEFNCIFCSESFDNKEELQTHFRKHGDPKFNQTVKNKLDDMASEKSEDGEAIGCDVCSEMFPTISKAITHKHKAHPAHDTKYFCPWCGKLFTMKHLYNKHIESSHKSEEQEQTGFHCDYCEVDFFVPTAMVYHNKFFHRQDTELAAIGHSKKLRMFNQEMLQIYYCPFCGEEYCNKVNLHKHMGDDHGDENQSPEDILRCPICDAVFYHLDAYELHLTFHSIDDLYSEDNAIAKEITEFSLEAVPPIMEKVENESQEEAGNSMGIEELLQQAMNESNDEDVVGKKRKKHKKHKKSKKAAITLDEFLTMNTDVFGEGIDFQGIEEVPSQIVAKQLNKKKPGPKPLPSELQKLKKQGIVIKKNPVKHHRHLQGVKVLSKQPNMNHLQNINKTNSVMPKSSNELLTKLLNQNNSQIKIVRKSAQSNSNTEEMTTENNAPDSTCVEDDEKQVEPLKENKDEKNVITKEGKVTQNGNDVEKSVGDIVSNQDEDEKTGQKKLQQLQSDLNNSKVTGNENKNENNSLDDSILKETDLAERQSEKRDSNPETTLNALRNISQNITIKSISASNTAQTDSKSLQVKNMCLKKGDDLSTFGESDIEDESDINKGDQDNSDDTSTVPHIQNDSKNSSLNLNALKHLSHLITVKPMSQSKNVTTTSSIKDTIEEKPNLSENEHDDSDITVRKMNERNEETDTNSTADKELQSVNHNTNSKLNALKSLSKHITIKSISQSPNNTADASETSHNINEDEDFEENIEYEKIQNNNKQNSVDPMKTSVYTKSPEVRTSPNVTNKTKIINLQNKEDNTSTANTTKTQSSESILKQLPNITAKPLNVGKNIKQQKIAQTTTKSVNLQKHDIVQSSFKQEEKKQEYIETFSIDDSDDEETGSHNISTNSQINKPQTTAMPKDVSKNIENKVFTDKSMDVLKSLSKHITIKPRNKVKEEILQNFDTSDNECDNVQQNIKKPESEVQNKLKKLSHITFKSNNNSGKQSTFSHDTQNIENDKHPDDYDSDSNTSEKVKITELPEDYSDDDFPTQNSDPDIDEYNLDKSVTVEEPHDSDNDNAADNEACDDIESQIKPNTIKNPIENSNKTPTCLNNLKNITIKSMKENKIKQNDNDEIPDELIPKQNKEHNRKPCQQASSISQDESRRAQATSKQQITKNVARNQNASTSSNQRNTVNKEVTVQRFQTKTVIQEITTTVTKTIRTVNQTVKQEVRNSNQNMSIPARPQKIQNFRPNQQIKNFQGTHVRTAPPIMGPRIRNPVGPRAILGPNIRPSNQLVPVRTGLNVARLSRPRMPTTKPPGTPSTSGSHQPVVGKPLKISPNAMLTSATKRPGSDETNGPFSCFKKVKESLIPGADTPDSSVQYASSHMSKSNFVSTTKIMQGNSVVTSSQTKSEASASCEQLTRLSGMSGLKVMKTSQTKQASKVEEKTEISGSNRSTLEAIERLQKQGLLVKKPRLDESNHSEHSNSENDDYYDT